MMGFAPFSSLRSRTELISTVLFSDSRPIAPERSTRQTFGARERRSRYLSPLLLSSVTNRFPLLRCMSNFWPFSSRRQKFRRSPFDKLTVSGAKVKFVEDFSFVRMEEIMTKEVDRYVRELLLVSYASLVEHKRKNRQCLFIVGFTICSLTPVVTTLGNQFIASISSTFACSYNNVNLFVCYRVE
jgi:hypothetical protein